MSLVSILLTAIDRIREPRLFSTERGYQGQLKTELDKLLDVHPADFTRPLVEEEYQKRAREHGLRLRPDIVVHIPFDRGVSPTRCHDNYLVVLLKKSAMRAKAEKDFAGLEEICSTLDYPVGAFVNIASTHLWLPHYARKVKGPFILHEIAVILHNGELEIRTCVTQLKEQTSLTRTSGASYRASTKAAHSRRYHGHRATNSFPSPEGKPLSIISDRHHEELVSPYLFSGCSCWMHTKLD